MSGNEKTSSKVYLGIMEQLKEMIEEDGLLPGDKIPSERELCERMQAGRSSVREALRALELLGLIETRRGEGTFIKDFQEHQLVELLGGFILQEEKSRTKLKETKYMMEINCLTLAVRDGSSGQIDEFIDWAGESDFDDYTFFQRIAALHDNHLLRRIWTSIAAYDRDSAQIHRKQPYLDLLGDIKHRDINTVVKTYMEEIRNMSMNG